MIDTDCYAYLGFRPNDEGMELLSWRQYLLAMRGHETRERTRWERVLYITRMWGDKTTIEKLFDGVTQIEKDDYESMLKRHGWDSRGEA